MARESLFKTVWRINRGWPLLLAVLLLFNIAGYLLRSEYFVSRNEGLEGQLLARQTALRQGQQEAQSSLTPQQQARRAQTDLTTFRRALPRVDKFTAFVGELFREAHRAGLRIDQIVYDPKEVKGVGVLRYTLEFSVAGSYSQVRRFIYALESSPRLVAIESVALSEAKSRAKAKKPGRAEVSLRLRLATYFRTDAT